MSHCHLALQLAYQGSRFSGFQTLPGRRTVQGELERVLSHLPLRAGPLSCAGRTDAGVHAYGQIVSFAAELRCPPARLLCLLQERLPEDLAVVQMQTVPETFHARFSARGRHYRYLLRLNAPPDPFQAGISWRYPYPLAPERLAAAWSQCQGSYDFACLARPDPGRHSSQMRVWLSVLRPLGNFWALEIVADRFLTSVVRRLVGTALDMARGRLPADYLSRILSGQEVPQQPEGRLAPAQGLILCRALYPSEYGLELNYPDPLPAELEAQIPSQALVDPGIWWD